MSSIRKALKKVFLARAATNLVMPLLAVAPPAILAASKMPNPWPAWFFTGVNEALTSKPWLQTLGTCWPWVVVMVGYVLTRLRDWLDADKDLGANELTHLLRTLDTPVGKKLKRFGKTAAGLKGKRLNGTSCKSVFLDITRPDEQLALLTESIHIFFLDDVEIGDNLKVTLARMKNGKIVHFEHFLPHGSGPRTSVENLQSDEVTFNVAAKGKQMVIIDDIAKEVRKEQDRRYAPGESNAGNEGSIICYPVVDSGTREVPYVISVKYSEPRHFTSARAKRYEYILKRFAERIALEHNLTQIKEAMTRDQSRS